MNMKDIDYFEPMVSYRLVRPPCWISISRWKVHREDSPWHAVGVRRHAGNGRGLQVAMAQQELDGAQIGAGVEQVGGKGVAPISHGK